MQFFNRKLNRIKRKKIENISSQPVSPKTTKNQIIANFFSKVKNSLNLLQSGYQQREKIPDQQELLRSLTRFKVPNRVKQLAKPKVLQSKSVSAKQSRLKNLSSNRTKREQIKEKSHSFTQQMKQKSKTISFTNTQYSLAKKINKMTKDQTQKKQENYINSTKLGILSSIKILQEKQLKDQQKFLLKDFFYSIVPQIEDEKSNQFQTNNVIEKKSKRRKRSIFIPQVQNLDKKTNQKFRRLYETIVSQNQFQNQDSYNQYHLMLMQKKFYPNRRKKSLAANINYQWKN